MTVKFEKNSADNLLLKAAELFKERNKVYGNNYLNVGHVMQGLFPQGVKLLTVDDFNRFHIFMLMVVKITRYTNNWKEGHLDSISDMTVYAAMLEMIDRDIADVNPPF